jgi:hypothetical protein
VSPKRQHMGVYVCFQPANFTAMHVAAFLWELLHHVRGHVILLWDRCQLDTFFVLEGLEL